MKGWRPVIVLLLLIILLTIILGIQMLNNTPEKQLARINEKYNNITNKDENSTEDDLTLITNRITTSTTAKKTVDDIRMNLVKSKLKSNSLVIILSLIYVMLYVISYLIIYYKMGINSNLIKATSISIAIMLLDFIFIGNMTILYISGCISIILAIILRILVFKIVGLSPWLLLIGLIPYVGGIGELILSIIVTCRVADYFGRGTGFKFGLILFPGIFYPILAFET